MIGPDFESVLEAARAGDHEALGRIYRAFAPAVLGYLRGQGAPDPEDLAQAQEVPGAPSGPRP